MVNRSTSFVTGPTVLSHFQSRVIFQHLPLLSYQRNLKQAVNATQAGQIKLLDKFKQSESDLIDQEDGLCKQIESDLIDYEEGLCKQSESDLIDQEEGPFSSSLNRQLKLVREVFDQQHCNKRLTRTCRHQHNGVFCGKDWRKWIVYYDVTI